MGRYFKYKRNKDYENEQYQCTRHAISMERRGS